MNADPFAGARCRDSDAHPAWWDVDASRAHVAHAAAICATCPAHAPCAAMAADLGPLASGVWAGEYHPLHAERTDETMALFLTIFGPAAPGATTTAHIQLTLDLDLTQTAPIREAC